MLYGTLMGQLTSTLHSQTLKLYGYFQLALMRSEVAIFFVIKKSSNRPFLAILHDNSKFECPSSVPFLQFCPSNVPFYLVKVNLSRGICNPLWLFFT